MRFQAFESQCFCLEHGLIRRLQEVPRFLAEPLRRVANGEIDRGRGEAAQLPELTHHLSASRGIPFNCIAPGMITTAMTDKLSEEQRARIAAAIPMGRFGLPDEIAAAAVYLASAEAGYITGQTLHINGGMTMV